MNIPGFLTRKLFVFLCLLSFSPGLFAEVPMEVQPEGAPREEPRRSFSGEEVVRAFYRAYPDRIERIALLAGDWAMLVDGSWFFWAEGRLLPEELRMQHRDYSPYPFYRYPRTLPVLGEPDPQEAARLRARVSSREENPPRRHPGFFNALWRIYDRDTSWARMKTTFFLGHRIELHRELLEDLAAVEETIQEVMKTDADLRRFVAGLSGFDAYNWRIIAGTASMSFHAYGAAVDLLPGDYRGLQAYWRWAARYYPDWFTLPYEQRFMPPDSFVRAFEEQGFIWGGKWFYFDTIHFEYRPELLILNGW
ncbi:M15 family metallopeptidase [Marispirochaeta aestuarii]|uniref:M15 family metallopeptidase n=1 Tax=Marispirochaeta aestuarii TaxID=1963862 RepID=UPI0029C68FAB|nr:M15 family metallopeptidase [Marispirochaeta aestuarii]